MILLNKIIMRNGVKSMRGRYKKIKKIETIMSKADFDKGMKEGLFHKPEHKGFIVLLYYTGIRSSEALRSTKEQFAITENEVTFNVGKRLKHGIETPALKLPKSLPYMNELIWCIESTQPKERVWQFTRRTAYNVVTRAFPFYPHYFRLNRITNLLMENYTLAQLHSWTGLTLDSLNAYVGIVDIDKMSKALS
jgi:integrase